MRIKVLFLSLMGTILACYPSYKPVDYKVVRDEVVQYHSKVMEDRPVIISQQLKLDTLYKNLNLLKADFEDLDTLKEVDTIRLLKARLITADDRMNNWMLQFEPDITGKSKGEAILYFQSEMKKIVAIDSIYKDEIQRSNKYLSKFHH